MMCSYSFFLTYESNSMLLLEMLEPLYLLLILSITAQNILNQIRNLISNDLLPGIFPFLQIMVQWLGNILNDKWCAFVAKHFVRILMNRKNTFTLTSCADLKINRTINAYTIFELISIIVLHHLKWFLYYLISNSNPNLAVARLYILKMDNTVIKLYRGSISSVVDGYL